MLNSAKALISFYMLLLTFVSAHYLFQGKRHIDIQNYVKGGTIMLLGKKTKVQSTSQVASLQVPANEIGNYWLINDRERGSALAVFCYIAIYALIVWTLWTTDFSCPFTYQFLSKIRWLSIIYILSLLANMVSDIYTYRWFLDAYSHEEYYKYLDRPTISISTVVFINLFIQVLVKKAVLFQEKYEEKELTI